MFGNVSLLVERKMIGDNGELDSLNGEEKHMKELIIAPP